MILAKESIKQITLPDLQSKLVLDCSDEKKRKERVRKLSLTSFFLQELPG